MKKRIIALTLVLVMAVLTLAGCGYSYAEDDMTKYSTFDKTAFEQAIAALVIEDGDYTADPETRKEKVTDQIYTSLVPTDSDGTKVTTGVIGAHDVIAYCYYVTAADVEGATAFLTSYMKEANAVKVQAGLSSLTDFQKKVIEAVKDFDLTDKAYKTSTTDKAVAGDVVYVSYKKTYTVVKEDGSKESQTDTVSYQRLVLTENSDDELIKNLTDVAAGTKKEFTAGEDDNKVTYTSAVVEWIVKGENEVTFTDVTYTEKKEVKDTNNVSYDLKDKELTYHIFPVYRYEIPEMTLETVITKMLTSPSDSSLPCFADEKYKKDDKTLGEQAAKLAELATALETAKDSDESDETKKNEAIESAQKAYDDQLALILALDEGLEATVIEEYREKVADTLLDTYNEDIRIHLAAAVWAKMQKLVTVTGTPSEAVDSVYDSMIDKYKTAFYTEDYTSSESNYKHYAYSFNAYLRAMTGTSTDDEARAAVRKDAETYVKSVVQIYAVAAAYGLTMTDAEFKTYQKENSNYTYNAYVYGDDVVRIGAQFDKLMDYFMESEESEDGEVTYKKVSYTLGAESEDGEGDTTAESN